VITQTSPVPAGLKRFNFPDTRRDSSGTCSGEPAATQSRRSHVAAGAAPARDRTG